VRKSIVLFSLHFSIHMVASLPLFPRECDR
jgi:hypothetical protein